MLEKSAKICTILKNQKEVELFNIALGEQGFRKITAFTSSKEAYEVAIRQQFDIFVTRMEMPEMSGVVFLQKIRQTGNYGHEVHLFVCEKLAPPILNVLYEFDVPYVLPEPLSKRTIGDKFIHLLKSENDLTPFEKRYREARAALYNNIVDMAEAFAKELYDQQPTHEKVLLLLGDIAASRDDGAQEMYRYYSAAKDANPQSAIANHKLAEAMMRLGRHKEAAVLLDEQAKLNPYNIKLLENAGLSNFEIQNYEKAASYAQKLKTVDEASKAAGQIEVKTKIAQGDFTGLAAALKNGHDDKEIVSYLNNAGVKLAKGNDVQGALRMYQSCVEQLQGSKYLHAVHYNMGLAYRRLGDHANAAAQFEKALKLQPEFEKAASALAEVKAKSP